MSQAREGADGQLIIPRGVVAVKARINQGTVEAG